MDSNSNNNMKPAKLFHTVYCPPNAKYKHLSPVIMVHGAGTTNSTWKGVRETIGDNTKRNIICVDIRNHGKSEWPDIITLDLMVLDLENFMEEQKIRKAILLGHSFSGRVTLGLAFKRPDLVEKLIVEDTFLRIKEPWMKFLKQMIALCGLVRKFPKTLSEKEAHDLVWQHAEAYFPNFQNTIRQNATKLFPFYKDKKTGLFKGYVDLDFEPKLGNLEFDLSNNPTYNGETLVLVAEKPSFGNSTSDVQELRKHLPNSQEEIIIGGIHALHLENPTQFVEATTRFINAVN